MGCDGRDRSEDCFIYIVEHGSISRSDIEAYIRKSTRTISRRLAKLVDDAILVASGNVHDPNRKYV